MRGNEHAWPLSSIDDVLRWASNNGWACIGGVFQFRTETRTGEPYWLCADSTARLVDEDWPIYCKRAADEVLDQIANIVRNNNLNKEAERWSTPAEKVGTEHLVFVPYFESQEGHFKSEVRGDDLTPNCD